jgi:uncharacterized protein YndB with AHSA1/START domain
VQDRSVERRVELPASLENVWQALTRGPQLSAWFGARVELEPRPGGRASFHWPGGTVREASVEVFDPGRQLLLRWLPFEREASGAVRTAVPGHIRFVLEPEDGCTILTVTESIFGEPFEETAPVMSGQVSSS